MPSSRHGTPRPCRAVALRANGFDTLFALFATHACVGSAAQGPDRRGRAAVESTSAEVGKSRMWRPVGAPVGGISGWVCVGTVFASQGCVVHTIAARNSRSLVSSSRSTPRRRHASPLPRQLSEVVPWATFAGGATSGRAAAMSPACGSCMAVGSASGFDGRG